MTIKWYLNALVKLANKSFCRKVSIQTEYSTEYYWFVIPVAMVIF